MHTQVYAKATIHLNTFSFIICAGDKMAKQESLILIRISKETKKQLIALKLVPQETYDSVIKRIIKKIKQRRKK